MAGAHGRKAPLWPGSRCSPHSVSAASVPCVGEHAGVQGGPLSCGGGLALQRSQQAAPASPTQAREEFPRSDRESVHPNLPAPCLGRRGRGPRNPWDNFKSPLHLLGESKTPTCSLQTSAGAVHVYVCQGGPFPEAATRSPVPTLQGR